MRKITDSFLVLLSLLLLAMPSVSQEPAPTSSRGLQKNEAGAFEGFTLITPLGAKFALLLDMKGEVVHRWETTCSPVSLYLLPNGNLQLLGHQDADSRFTGPGVGGGVIQEITWTGEPVWEHVISNEKQLIHHDLERLPGGNVLVIAWEYVPREEVIRLGRDPEHVDEKGMWFDTVYELRPGSDGAEVVWEWHVLDHLIQDHAPDGEDYGSIPDHPGRLDINFDHRDRRPLTLDEMKNQAEVRGQMLALGYIVEEDKEAKEDGRPGHTPDWLHTNAIDHHPELDLLVLSSPHLNELFVIDHSTSSAEAASSSGGRWGKGGDLLWRWGNPRNYGAGNDDDQKLFYQHDPKWLAGQEAGDLRILVFNNGMGRPQSQFSSVEELVLPFDREKGFVREGGESFLPSDPIWNYFAKDEFFSPFISGSHRVANGNTIICSGVPGRIFEVTRDYKIVWDYLNVHEGEPIKLPNPPPPTALFRATRFGADYPGLAKLRE